MQIILATSDFELSKLAVMADKFVDVTNSFAVNITATKSKVDNSVGIRATLTDLHLQILSVNKKIDKPFKLCSWNISRNGIYSPNHQITK